MSLHTDTPIVHRSMQSSQRQAREVVRLITEAGDLSPSYQRGSVWTVEQRLGLIRSWLIGLPIPAVIVNKRFDGNWPCQNDGWPVGGYEFAVIDGKQRIETAIAWFGDELAVPASWFDGDDINSTVESEDGDWVFYSGLTEQARRVFALRSMLPVIETDVSTEAEEAEIYLLVNATGTSQTVADLANAQQVAGQEVTEQPSGTLPKPEDVVGELLSTYGNLRPDSTEAITAESVHFLAARAVEYDRALRQDENPDRQSHRSLHGGRGCRFPGSTAITSSPHSVDDGAADEASND